MRYVCSFCAKTKSGGWRCSDCGMLQCDNCSKGGGSSALGAAGRLVAGIATYGASEVVRAGYRKTKQHCVGCKGGNLVRV